MWIFFRFLFLGVLFASLTAWAYFGYVSASMREAILIEDHYKGIAQDNVIYPGTTRFIPTRIFPGRITLHRVRLFPRFLDIYFKKGLKQSEMLGLDDSFYIRVVLRLDYKLNPQKLSSLFQGLSKANWEALQPYIELRLEKFLEQRVSKLYKGDKDLTGLKGRLQAYWRTLALNEFNKEFSNEGVEFLNVLHQETYVPDPAHYQAILSAGQQIIKQKLERIRIVDLAQAHRDAEQIKNQNYFTRLERIAKLLQTYPHLRDYLALDHLGKNVEVMVVPYEHWFSASHSNSLLPLVPSKNKKDKKRTKAFQKGNLIPYAERSSKNSALSPRESNSRGNSQGSDKFSDLSPP